MSDSTFYGEDGRPSRHLVYFNIARMLSQRATCERRKVGAVLVKDKRIIATGYNGSPSGAPHCIDVGCYMVGGHCVRTVHAEASIISMCAKYGISTEGTEIYVTSFPCVHCAKILINAGIETVYYEDDYTDSEGELFFKETGVKVYRIRRLLNESELSRVLYE